MVRVGRDLKNHLLPTPCHGERHLPQADQSLVRLKFSRCKPSAINDQILNVFRITSENSNGNNFLFYKNIFFSCYIFTLTLLSFFKESQSFWNVIYSTEWFILFKAFAIAFYNDMYLLLHTRSTYPMSSLPYTPCNLGMSGTVL